LIREAIIISADKEKISIKRMVINSLLILVLGIILGIISKALDNTEYNELPRIMQMLDITIFLGRFAVWIFIAVCISVYSKTNKRAALNVFLFFAGMVTSYYIYSATVAGFFPRTYAMIWFGITLISPALAFACWYARSEGKVGILISSGITGVLLSQAVFLLQGMRITHVLEVVIWLASLCVLRRKPKEFAVMTAISIPVALLIQLFVPYWG